MKSEWAAALQKHIMEKVVDPPPAGWKTIKDISKELRKTTCHTNKIVRKMIKLGLVETKSYRCLISQNGQKAPYTRLVPHYRLLDKVKSKSP
jgi:predicted transcriptional regulator